MSLCPRPITVEHSSDDVAALQALLGSAETSVVMVSVSLAPSMLLKTLRHDSMTFFTHDVCSTGGVQREWR